VDSFPLDSNWISASDHDRPKQGAILHLRDQENDPAITYFEAVRGVYCGRANTHHRLRNRLFVAAANCSRPRWIYEQAIPQGTHRYRSEIL
jgi:hypothetical protein